MPNFSMIAQTVAEIWRFFDFSTWRATAILDFQNIQIWRRGRVRRVNMHRLPNFAAIGQSVAEI